ncbi:MAG: hypothetical protein Q9208_007792 [Pyrenodesmia sp. 3 TL-2023]
MTKDFWNELPEVGAVTCLLLRRQTRRRWEPTSLKEMVRLLPRLQEIYYEPWREWDQIDQGLTDKDTKQLFESPVFRRLRRLVLFEDSSDDYVTAFRGVQGGYNAELVRTADIAVSKALAEASLEFQHLSASFIVDARWFFEARQPCWAWNQLTSLVLTSQLLNPYESHAVANQLFQGAAAAAMEMPMLTTMELWNGGEGLACVFRYQAFKGSRPATIIWRGNWDIKLEPRTIRAWESVALQHAQGDLQVIKELLDAEVIESHGDAIHLLGFLHPVVHPVSLWQIQKEIGS